MSASGTGSSKVVEEELQQYLTEKGVNGLFLQIVEQLLLEKPDQPVTFIVNYLVDKFPKQTEIFQRTQTKQQENDVEGKTIETEEEKDNDEEEEEETSSEEEDEDDFDDIGELKQFEPPKQVVRSRRVSVSAAVLNEESLAEQKQNTIKFPKTDEEAEKLKTIISQTLLCSHLDVAERQKLVDAMEKQEIDADVEIITQGDKYAEHYYVLEKGTAIVEKDGVKVLDYSDGDDFGELALMYNAPRAATVKTTSPCIVWRLDQVTFKVIVMASSMRKRQQNVEFLANVPMFKEMEEQERNVLADALKTKELSKGDIIVKQGDPGDEFFILAEGVVNVEVNGDCIGDLNEGQYFGEIALLTQKPRQATIIASSSTVKVLSVHRKAFQRVLGPLEDILKRNLNTYTKYVAGVQM